MKEIDKRTRQRIRALDEAFALLPTSFGDCGDKAETVDVIVHALKRAIEVANAAGFTELLGDLARARLTAECEGP